MPKGVVFAINNADVWSPDEDIWTPVVTGQSLTGEQKRSPYRRLEWRRLVTDMCDLDGSAKDWFHYDNVILDSLTTRPPGRLDEHTIYTDAVCQSVTFRARRGVGSEVVATFLVNVG